MQSYATIDDALEEVLVSVIVDICNSCTEASLAVVDISEKVEKLGHILIRVARLVGESSGMDTRSAVEGLDLETCIVGESLIAGMLESVLCLDDGVAFESVGRFGDILRESHLVESDDREFGIGRLSEDSVDLLSLIMVV